MKKIDQSSMHQIEQVISTLKELFDDSILSIYLYGSSVLGELQRNSDIDILVIIDGKIAESTRIELTKKLLQISGKVGCQYKRPLEVTIINKKNIISKKIYSEYEYMYGEWIRQEIESGNLPQPNYDDDLIVLLWQAQKHSILLDGTNILNLIPPISDNDLKKAILSSLPTLLEGIIGDERNTLLTLARMWYTLDNHDICTKDCAGKWTLNKLPKDFRELMELAIKGYLGECSDNWSDKKDDLLKLVTFLKEKIQN